jgi:hypothetical protein
MTLKLPAATRNIVGPMFYAGKQKEKKKKEERNREEGSLHELIET